MLETKLSQSNDYKLGLRKLIDAQGPTSRDTAMEVLNDYLRQGRTFRFVYLAFQQLNGRSITKYRHMMFNKAFLQQIQYQYIRSLAEDLDVVLFNEWLNEADLKTIRGNLDVDAYNRAERKCLYDNWGNDEAYKNAVIDYLSDVLLFLAPQDLSTIDCIVSETLEKGDDLP